MATGNAQGIKAGQAYVSLYLNDSILDRGLKAAAGKIKAFGEEIKNIGKTLMIAGGAIAGPLLGGAKIFASTGDELNDLSKMTGMSAAALAEFGYVAKMNGAGMDAIKTGVKGMSRIITEAGMGTEMASDALASLNLSFQDLETLSPEERFTLILDRLGRITDETYRAAVAQEVLGKSGMALLPMADLGASGINTGRRQARNFGLSWTKEDADLAGDLDDSFAMLTEVAKKLAVTIGGALAPALTQISQWLSRAISGTFDFIKQNKELIVTVAKIAAVVFGVGAALTGFGYAMIGISSAIKTFGSILHVIFGAIAMLTSPLTIIIGLLGVASVSLVSYYGGLQNIGNGIKNVFSESIKWVSTSNNVIAESMRFMGDSIKTSFGIASDTFSGIRDALAAGDIQAAFDIVVLGLKAAWEKLSYDFKLIWYSVQETLVSTWFKTVDEIKTRFNELKLLWGDIQAKAFDKTTDAYLKITGDSDDPFAKMAKSILQKKMKDKNVGEYKEQKKENDKARETNEQALSMLSAEHANKLTAQNEELAAAMQRLKDASSAAASAATKDAERRQATLPDVNKLLGGIELNMNRQANSIYGAFNTMGFRGQGYGANTLASPMSKVASNTAEIAANTKATKEVIAVLAGELSTGSTFA